MDLHPACHQPEPQFPATAGALVEGIRHSGGGCILEHCIYEAIIRSTIYHSTTIKIVNTHTHIPTLKSERYRLHTVSHPACQQGTSQWPDKKEQWWQWTVMIEWTREMSFKVLATSQELQIPAWDFRIANVPAFLEGWCLLLQEIAPRGSNYHFFCSLRGSIFGKLITNKVCSTASVIARENYL